MREEEEGEEDREGDREEEEGEGGRLKTGCVVSPVYCGQWG